MMTLNTSDDENGISDVIDNDFGIVAAVPDLRIARDTRMYFSIVSD